MGAAVSEYEGAGRPGVGGANVQRIGRLGAEFPRRVQVTQLAPPTHYCVLRGVGIVVGKAFVDVAVEDDGLW
jgi:hypothetical protein